MEWLGLSVGSIFGAIAGAISGALVMYPWFASWRGGGLVLALAGTIVLVIAGYLAARYTTGGVSELFRGFLIGVNAGVTLVLIAAVTRPFLPTGVAFAIGAAVAAIVLLSAIDAVSQSIVYQGILGWASWLVPTTWPINAFGLAFFALNAFGALVTLGRAAPFAITGFTIDWKTATMFMKGGWISNLNRVQTAFDMGHFGLVHRASSSYYLAHETGHTLSLGAFGSVFHLVGFIDELTAAGSSAYAERLAEGHDRFGNGPKLPMWS